MDKLGDVQTYNEAKAVLVLDESVTSVSSLRLCFSLVLAFFSFVIFVPHVGVALEYIVRVYIGRN